MEKPSQNDSKLMATIELKSVLMHKMRLRVWGYSNGGNLYIAVDGSLILKYKTYTIKSIDDELEAWKAYQKECTLDTEFGSWAEDKNKKVVFYLFLGH